MPAGETVVGVVDDAVTGSPGGEVVLERLATLIPMRTNAESTTKIATKGVDRFEFSGLGASAPAWPAGVRSMNSIERLSVGRATNSTVLVGARMGPAQPAP